MKLEGKGLSGSEVGHYALCVEEGRGLDEEIGKSP